MKTPYIKIRFLVVIFSSFLLGGCFKDDSPITVEHRDSKVGRGKVAVITNPSDKKIVIDVLVSSDETDQEKEFNYTLNPKTFTEIGWAEGWQFVSGEEIVVSSSKYSDVEYIIP